MAAFRRYGRPGFTLIELLVVIAIISILMLILLPVVEMIRDRARGVVTATRLDEAMRALTTLAVSSGETPGFAIHRYLQERKPTVVRGVLIFRRNLQTGIWSPGPTLTESDPPATMQAWITPPYRAYEFAHPWGSTPTEEPGNIPNRLTPTGTINPLETHQLGDLTPVLSAELLRLGGVFESGRFPTDAEAVTAYRTDRRRDQPWNDGWGRPLLLGFALYHPRRFATPRTPRRDFKQDLEEDQGLASARKAYGYIRSIYVAGASIGPRLPVGVTDADLADSAADWTTEGTGLLAKLWGRTVAVAGSAEGIQLWRTDGAVLPVVNAFSRPPWTGVRQIRSDGAFCFLSAPVEIR